METVPEQQSHKISSFKETIQTTIVQDRDKNNSHHGYKTWEYVL